MARAWGVPTSLNPLAVLGIPLAGAAGAALGGAAGRLPPGRLALVFGIAVLALGGAGLAGHPAGLVAVAVFYGLYRMVLVVAEARLQEEIEGPARATVTSVAELGSELVAFAVYAAWALGQVVSVAALGLAIAAVLPRWLRLRHVRQVKLPAGPLGGAGPGTGTPARARRP